MLTHKCWIDKNIQAQQRIFNLQPDESTVVKSQLFQEDKSELVRKIEKQKFKDIQEMFESIQQIMYSALYGRQPNDELVLSFYDSILDFNKYLFDKVRNYQLSISQLEDFIQNVFDTQYNDFCKLSHDLSVIKSNLVEKQLDLKKQTELDQIVMNQKNQVEDRNRMIEQLVDTMSAQQYNYYVDCRQQNLSSKRNRKEFMRQLKLVQLMKEDFKVRNFKDKLVQQIIRFLGFYYTKLIGTIIQDILMQNSNDRFYKYNFNDIPEPVFDITKSQVQNQFEQLKLSLEHRIDSICQNIVQHNDDSFQQFENDFQSFIINILEKDYFSKIYVLRRNDDFYFDMNRSKQHNIKVFGKQKLRKMGLKLWKTDGIIRKYYQQQKLKRLKQLMNTCKQKQQKVGLIAAMKQFVDRNGEQDLKLFLQEYRRLFLQQKLLD